MRRAKLSRRIQLTYSKTMSSKNPEKSFQRNKTHLFSSMETNRKLLRPSTKTKRMPVLKRENSATPIELRFKELHFGLRAREYQSSVIVFYPSSFFSTGANVRSINGCTFQKIHDYVKIVHNERKRRIVIENDEDDWLLSFFCQLCTILN